MNLAVVTPTALKNPNQPPLPGLEPDVIARYSAHGSGPLGQPVKINAAAPIDAPVFAGFDEAVGAAREIMVGDRSDARWGMFKRLPGKVASIALMQVGDGIKLLRSTLPVDSFKEPVRGQMFPGQHWWIHAPVQTVRETPATLALVGADRIIDLRSGNPVDAIEFPKQ